MKLFLGNEIFLIALTLIVYFSALRLFYISRLYILNPILVSILVIIAFLSLSNIHYNRYYESTGLIGFFLKPAVVALGVPLYNQLKKINKQFVIIIVSELAGCLTGIISVVLIGSAAGASRQIILSLASKSVTTPIAMEISAAIGGIPSLTSAIVIAVGIFGAIFGSAIMKLAGIRNPVSQSISMGTAAHAIGTARFAEIGPDYGAYASFGMVLNGILTSLLTPFIISMLDLWFHF